MMKFSFGALLFSALLALAACNEEAIFGFNPPDGPSGPNPPGPFSPCEEGVRTSMNGLPDEIRNYLSDNYPGFSYKRIRQFSDPGGEIRYGIVIEHQGEKIEFYFGADGAVINSGNSQPDQGVAVSDLPAPILGHLDGNFPGIPIDTAEMEWQYGMSFFEVELADGTELYFSEDGTFLCNDNDGDDDGDDDDDDDGDDDDDDDDHGPHDIPANIYTFVQDNYPGSEIREVGHKRLCGGAQALEVKLRGESFRLFFDTDGNFLFSSSRSSEQALPQAVRDAIASEFPDYSIRDDKVKVLEFEDGSKQYQVELRAAGNHDDEEITAIFSEDGSLVCSEED